MYKNDKRFPSNRSSLGLVLYCQQTRASIIVKVCIEAVKQRNLSRKKNLCNDVHVFTLERNVAFRVYSFDAEDSSCNSQPIRPSVTM